MEDSNLKRLEELTKHLNEVEYKLARANALLAAIVENADESIISKDLDGRIISWNPAAERMYQYTSDEAIGEHISLIIPPEKKEEFNWFMNEVNQGIPCKDLHTKRRRKDGKILDVIITVSPIRDSTGKIIGASAITRLDPNGK